METSITETGDHQLVTLFPKQLLLLKNSPLVNLLGLNQQSPGGFIHIIKSYLLINKRAHNNNINGPNDRHQSLSFSDWLSKSYNPILSSYSD